MTSDYLSWPKCLELIKYLKKENEYRWCAIFTSGFFLGLRISDLKTLRWKDVEESISVTERKTGKTRLLTVNQEVINLLLQCKKNIEATDNDFILNNGKGSTYTKEWVSNRLEYFCGKIGVWNLNISTHTMRKSFGRQIWEVNGMSDSSLILLSNVFGHSTTSITRKYLGIRSEEVSAAYKSLTL